MILAMEYKVELIPGKSLIIFDELQQFPKARQSIKQIEIDFIISNNSKWKPKICSLEVKSMKRYKTASLEKFISKYSKRIEKAYVAVNK